MSQENVEAIKNAFAAWNDCDMESFRELFDPEVISRPPEDWPEQAPVVGREAVMRNYDQLRDAWELDTVEAISDFVDVGERVAVRWSWRGVGRGPDFNWEVTGVFTFRNGKIFYVEHFRDHADALKAAR